MTFDQPAKTITYDDGSVLFLDARGNSLGAIDTGGTYVPPRANVGDQLNGLLNLGVSQAISRVLGGNRVTTQTATTSAPQTGITTSQIITALAIGAVVVGAGLGVAALVKG